MAACNVYHIYPDPNQMHFRRALSIFLSVPEDYISGGTGSDELLDLVFRLFDPAAIVNLPPTFGMYPFLVRFFANPVLEMVLGRLTLPVSDACTGQAV
jgi:histidinol-phosphate aminotransferase